MEIIKNYGFLIAFAFWIIYKWSNSRRIKAMLPELEKQGAMYIDVRSASEFRSGSAPATINIPLPELRNRLKEIPKNKPLVLCCASGTRSGMAKMLLRKNGFKTVYNIGTWTKFLK